MVKFILAPLIVFIVLGAWVLVQRSYARFTVKYPQLGPFRDAGGGCSCGNGSCERS